MHLSKSRTLLEQYYFYALDANIGKRGEHFLHEVRSRLRELQWMFARISLLCNSLIAQRRNDDLERGENTAAHILIYVDSAKPRGDNLDAAITSFDEKDELRILLEAYYYSAHRVGDILKDGKKELPGVNGFECKAISIVRNHLVEHPTKKGGVIVFSFSVRESSGPKHRVLRWSFDPKGSEDEGLWVNAMSFEKEINARLERAIENIEP